MTIIDCHTCPVRGHDCACCFVPVVASQWLHGEDVPPEQPSAPRALPLSDAEWDAVDTFVTAGLVNVLDVVDLVATTEVVPTAFRQVG